MRPDCLIVVCYYDARSSAPLSALLDQIETIDAGADFDLMVIVNHTVNGTVLPAVPRNCQVLYRENNGYNIGAWQHGWMHGRGYRYYLFLQDECIIAKPSWLKAFIYKAQMGYDLIGESLIVTPSIGKLSAASSDFIGHLRSIEQRLGLRRTHDLTHVQTTIVFCTGKILESTNGFVSPSNHKIQAIACEVAFSLLARHFGYKIAQVAFLPFEYICHPQWSDLRQNMATPIGRIRRFFRIVFSSLLSSLRSSYSIR